MKKDGLFYTLMKSYVFTLAMGTVSIVLLLFVIQFTSVAIEFSLGWLLLFVFMLGMNVWLYSLWTAKRITKPLEHIAGAIRQMTQGHYQQRLDYKADYEFSLIQKHFNELAEALERAEVENQRLTNSKQRMLADLSHDLKTPITTIQGYTKALQLGLADNEEKQAHYLDLIYNKSILVTSLIDDIFNLSILDSPDYPFAAVPGDMAELIRTIAAEYYDLFDEKHFTITLDVPFEELIMSYNPKLLHRAVSNLLSNALKYNPPGTEVTITLQDEDHAVRLYITDNGIGIPESLKDIIFDPFVRGDASRKSKSGTGLGLAIAKKTAELHGGELDLDSSGGRTSFRLTLHKHPVRPFNNNESTACSNTLNKP